MTMMGTELGYTGNRVLYSKLWVRLLALLIFSFVIGALTLLEEFNASSFFLNSNQSGSVVQLKKSDLESGNNDDDDKDVEQEEEMLLTQQDEEVTPTSDIVVMVMGEEAVFRTWLHRLQSIKGQLTFIYASFDKEILLTKDELELDFNYDTLFIPNTTWTEGRTMLGEEALRKEKARKIEFDYWLFADDDVDFTCLENDESHSFFGDEENCWQRVFDFIARDEIPAKASAIVAQFGTAGESMAAMSTYDALFNAFKREYVPYLQPYVKLPKGFSEWMSQGALFCLLKTCMPGSAVVLPYMKVHNTAHRDYTRGLNNTQIQIAIRNNYDDNEMNFHPCPKPFDLSQNQDYIHKFQSLSELNDNMQTSDITQCDAMKKRFQQWQSTVLGKN